jgi:indolepyruvate ferredoxin oxidoreductase
VCEGCGDCGERSSCLSVTPTATEYGRKTQVHQSTCTQDLACLEGDCPSFLVVTPAERRPPVEEPPAPAVALPDPTPALGGDDDVVIRMPGVGGTGVVTVSQILQVAALLDGKQATGLDQTGLAQKGGAVISDVRIAPAPRGGAVRAAGGEVDLLLGLDLLGAVTADTLRTLDPQRTIAVVNLHQIPTASEVTDPRAAAMPVAEIVARIEAATRADRALWLDAGTMAEQLFGDHMPANMIMLGAAYQHGCLPVRSEAIEQAIELNGTGIAMNLAAFRWGRAAVVDRLAVERAIAERAPAAPTPPAVPAMVTRAVRARALGGPLADLVARRAGDLAAYQSTALAIDYVDRVATVAEAEHAAVGDGAGPIATAFARSLHRLRAYKDEYEVARLHLDAVERARVEQAFGADARVQVLLHPPALRAMGLRRKIRLGRTATPVFRALHAARRLRGTPLDPFGYARVRRVERALIEEYCAAMKAALAQLGPDTAALVATIAALPDQVRGYEQIKLDSVERYRAQLSEHLRQLAPDPIRPSATTAPGRPTG